MNTSFEKVGDVLKVVPFLGPTLHYGLSAKLTTSAQGQKSETINMYDKDDDGEDIYGHFNVFVGGGVALDIAEIVRVSLGYDLGLLERSKNTDEGSIKDKGGIRLGVSYLF